MPTSGSAYLPDAVGYPCACGGWVSPGYAHRCWPSVNLLPQTPVPEGWRLALSAEDVDRIARRVVELWQADSDAVAALTRNRGGRQEES